MAISGGKGIYVLYNHRYLLCKYRYLMTVSPWASSTARRIIRYISMHRLSMFKTSFISGPTHSTQTPTGEPVDQVFFTPRRITNKNDHICFTAGKEMYALSPSTIFPCFCQAERTKISPTAVLTRLVTATIR